MERAASVSFESAPRVNLFVKIELASLVRYVYARDWFALLACAFLAREVVFQSGGVNC